MWTDLSSFYRSKEWRELTQALKIERVSTDGFLYCEHCGKPIVKEYDCIGHHKEHLTIDNVNKAEISLNPDNISLVHFRCHNDIHNRYGAYTRHVYLVYGCPLSGKSSYVKERAGMHDLVIDIDAIYTAISNNPPYIKSGRLFECMEAVRQALLDCIKYKRGRYVNAWIIGGFPFKGERERIAAEYGAEEVFIDCTKDEALARLQAVQDGRDIQEWTKYIETWHARYTA